MVCRVFDPSDGMFPLNSQFVNQALQQNLWVSGAAEDAALWKSSKGRNFPTELANAAGGIRTSPTAPTTGYQDSVFAE